MVEGPGQAMLPRTPQNRTRIGDFAIHVRPEFTSNVFGMDGDVEQVRRAIDRIYFDLYFIRPCVELRACKTCSAAVTPVSHPPCAVEKSPREQASPAKKSRASTGAASAARRSAIPGIAYEYEPRANGSARQRWMRIGFTLCAKSLPSRSTSCDTAKSKNAFSPLASRSAAHCPPK